jgi:tyrosine-protein kinase
MATGQDSRVAPARSIDGPWGTQEEFASASKARRMGRYPESPEDASPSPELRNAMSESFSFPSNERQGVVRYLEALRRHWRLITLLVVIAVTAAAAYSYTTEKEYEASADILIQPISASDENYQGFTLFRQTFDGSSVVVTAARVINSPAVRRSALARLGSDRDNVSISVEPLGQANIVSIVTKAPDPEQAARAANAFAAYAVQNRTDVYQKELQEKISLLQRRIASIPAAQRQGNFEYATLQQNLANYRTQIGSPDPTLQVLTEARTPSSPTWPRPKLSIAAALFAALLLGGGIAVLLEFANPRLSREEELQLHHRLPILARIPRLSRKVARGYLTGRTPLPGGAWKAYRVLRASLANAGPNGGYPRSILVTSATPGDAKTTTAVNLAITFAASNMRVVLVDGDVHRPMISSFFNIVAHRDGFIRMLAERGTLDTTLVQTPLHPRLKLLLSTHQGGGHGYLNTTRFRRVLNQLYKEADVVVIDSPPLTEVAEVLEMADEVEAVLIAVHLGHTNRQKLNELREMLARRGVTPVGFAVTTRERLQRESEYDYPGELSPTTGVERSGDGQEAVGASRVVRLNDR